jgi:glycine cleavage system H protein
MKISQDCRYTRDHEWTRLEDGILTVGITDYAQDKLGEIVFVELPSEHDVLRKDEPFGVVESTKNASDILSPVNGKVAEANEVLEENPELINSDPFDEGWIIKIQPDDEDETGGNLSADEYRDFIDSLDVDED